MWFWSYASKGAHGFCSCQNLGVGLQSHPLILTGKPSHSKDLGLLVAPPDFQSFLRPWSQKTRYLRQRPLFDDLQCTNKAPTPACKLGWNPSWIRNFVSFMTSIFKDMDKKLRFMAYIAPWLWWPNFEVVFSFGHRWDFDISRFLALFPNGGWKWKLC